MLPIISVPGTFSAYNTTSAISSAVAASDVAIGRLPTETVAPTISLPELNNNSRGNSGGRPPLVLPAQTNSTQQPFTPGIASRISEPTLNLGTSTLFLAQLFAQSDMAVSITGNASQFVDYSTFVQYGLVKYKPSNAAMVHVERATKAEPAPSEQIRMASRQAAAQLEAATVSRQVQQAPASAPATAATAASTAAQNIISKVEKPEFREMREQASQRASARGGATTSLIRQRGVEAYMATFARNYANINLPAARAAELSAATGT